MTAVTVFLCLKMIYYHRKVPGGTENNKVLKKVTVQKNEIRFIRIKIHKKQQEDLRCAFGGAVINLHGHVHR